MDGLLIDSEDLYTLCTNTVLREYGRPDLPWSIKSQLQGRPAPEASRIFREWAQLPVPAEEYHKRTAELQLQYFPNCKPLPGVPELLENLGRKTSPKVHIALATSSQKSNFLLKTQKLQDLFSIFLSEQRVLGDDPRIPKGKGKPAPDIYLVALETINQSIREANKVDGTEQEPEIRPEQCLVFEDSVPGVEAGRRAGMQVVWCPHPGLLNEYKGREKEVLAGITGVSDSQDDKKMQPGMIDDGWGRLFESLTTFPYADYGIHVR
ncbi:MAG: hypothetical protein M1820_001070 [Bogoriella megaspora]|nr:MAG: hypothetical protein M1820_001070 [Bogoriella megaspora]